MIIQTYISFTVYIFRSSNFDVQLSFFKIFLPYSSWGDPKYLSNFYHSCHKQCYLILDSSHSFKTAVFNNQCISKGLAFSPMYLLIRTPASNLYNCVHYLWVNQPPFNSVAWPIQTPVHTSFIKY